MNPLHFETGKRVDLWKSDPDVVGILWVGSRSRGYGDKDSDDDLEVLLAPEAFSQVDPLDSYVMAPAPGASPPRLIYDAQLTSLETLRAKASSPRDLDHWPYERAQLLFDRTGEVAAAVKAVAAMAPEFRRARIQHGALDAVLAVGRARKTRVRGYPAATCLLVGRGARALTRVLFALEGRWAPLDHWWEPELKTLTDPFGVGPLLREALTEGAFEPLQEALTRLQPQLEVEGFPAADRARFFSELMHPDRASERAIHGLD